MRRLMIGLMVLLALAPKLASAHAKLVSSTPADGATLASAPQTIQLRFDSEVRSEGVDVQVSDASGARVDQGNGKVDLNDIDRRTVLVGLKSGLSGGVYIVDWTVVSDDGDPVSGSFRFTVQGAAQPTQAPPARATAAPATQPTAAAPAQPGAAPPAQPTAALPATGGLPSSIPGLSALVLTLLIGGYLLQRRAVKL